MIKEILIASLLQGADSASFHIAQNRNPAIHEINPVPEYVAGPLFVIGSAKIAHDMKPKNRKWLWIGLGAAKVTMIVITQKQARKK